MRTKEIINGNYIISEYGDVSRLRPERGTVVGKRNKPHLDFKGYLRVRLTDGVKVRNYRIHRLVALAFIPNPENYDQVNHKDCNKLNNHVDNLEWCTNDQNKEHAVKNNLCNNGRKGKFGKDHNKSIPIRAVNIITGEERIFYGICEAVRELKTNTGSIWRVRKGIYKHTKNWAFEKY